jgi:hypothetical protein
MTDLQLARTDQYLSEARSIVGTSASGPPCQRRLNSRRLEPDGTSAG